MNGIQVGLEIARAGLVIGRGSSKAGGDDLGNQRGADLSWLLGGDDDRDQGADAFVFAQARAETDASPAVDGPSDGGALTSTMAHLEIGGELQAAQLVGPAGGLLEIDLGADTSLVVDSYTSGKGGLGVTSKYNITVNFEGTWTEDLQQRFILAAEYLSSLITGDVKNKGAIDDIVITATLSEIDGVNGILGQAGPTGFRFNGWLPTKGIMEFDVADAATFDAQGLFDDIVIHEMLHTLGFGTIWDLLGLTTGTIADDNMLFTGKNAKAALKALFPDIWADLPRFGKGVAVETDGGSGTAGGHWDEETFSNELMTGYIDDENYVSAMTVAALEDMGYQTVFNASNPTAPMLQPDDLLIVS